MASYLNTPEFPLFSYKITLPEISITLTNTTTATSVNLTFPAGAYYGFTTEWNGTVGSAVASAGTHHRTLCDLIDAALASTFSDPGATCFTTYTWSTSSSKYLYPTIFIIPDTTLGDTYTIQFSSNWQDFGYNVSTLTFAAAGSPVYGDDGNYTAAGIWTPRNLTILDNRNPTKQVFRTEPATGVTISTVSWGPQKVRRTMICPIVYAARIFEYRRVLTVFSGPAEVERGDPNNLLEDMMDNLSEDASVQIHQGFANSGNTAGSYWTAQYIGEGVRDLSAIIEDISGAGQLFSVNLDFYLNEKIGDETI